jgi:Fur family transcriptional regulator, peroxide stress response regulator
VDEKNKAERLQQYQQLCREQNRRATVQRRMVLEAVLDLDNHPTADQVCEALAGREPGIARTTVYRSLDELGRMGLISKASHLGSAVRYDARADRHHHLVCLRCDAVIDIDDERLDAVGAPDTSAFGFEVTDVRVQLHGLCRSCRKPSRREESK